MSDVAHIPGFLRKPKREGITKIFAHSLKPPSEIIDESGDEKHQYFINYVADGVEYKKETDHAVWKRVIGPRSTPGRRVPGMDNLIHDDFYIIMKKDRVVGIDVLPKNRFEKGMVPEDMKEIEHLTIQVDLRTGDFTIKKLPPKVQSRRIRSILDALDKVEVVEPGQLFAECEVVTASGNIIVLDVTQGEV